MVCPRSVQIAHKAKTLLGYTTITHPFHPLHGRNYEVLKVKEVNKERLYSLRTGSGVVCVPESWTDRKIQPECINGPKLPFDVHTLKELAQLLLSFKNAPKAEKIVDRKKKER